MGDPRLLLQHQLRIPGDPRRKLGWQGNRFIQRVRMEALRPPQHRRHRFIGRADDVVVGVLLLQGHARGLAMRPKHQRRRLLRPEPIHDPVPQHPRGAQLCDLHEEVHPDGKEER